MYSSVSRGLKVLEVLAQESQPLALAEVARRIGSSKSGIHGLLATLARGGYVERRDGGIYCLGMKAWELGRAVPVSALVRSAAAPMDALAADSHEGAVLGVLDGFDVVYVHLVEGTQAVRVHASVGDRIPAHCTSTGLALLASLPEDWLDRIVPPTLPAVTGHTIVDRRQLMAELKRVRGRGYAINRGGWRPDVGGLAVRIGGECLGMVAGLCTAAPLYRMTRSWVDRVAPRLVRAGDEIAAACAPSPRRARQRREPA